jgi:Tol biopolymer transport system component
MLLLKVMAAAATVAVVLPQPVDDARSLVTIAQRDEWRTAHDPPSVSISENGRYVAFASYAQLVPLDDDRQRDVYVLDRATGQVTLESAADEIGAANADSIHPRLSADGQLLVYQTNIFSSAHWTTAHVVLRRREDGTTTVVTARLGLAAGAWWSHNPVISGDGRAIVFASSANLISNGTVPHREELYAYEVATGSVRRIAADAPSSKRSSVAPAVSHDGRYVAFTSTARGTPSEVLVCDTDSGGRRPIPTGGRAANGASWSAAIDAAGRHVAFVSEATNLAAGDRNRAADVFVADLQTGTVELISRSAGGGSANGRSGAPALSADGRFVAFQSEASDLVCAKNCAPAQEDINLLWDVFLYDRSTRTMSRLSAHAGQVWMEASTGPALDARAEVTAFSSRHPTDDGDVRNDFDLFVRGRAPSVPYRMPPAASDFNISIGSRVPARALAARIRSALRPWSRSLIKSSTGTRS